MQDYDVALKILLQDNGGLLIRDLTHSDSVKWLNVELPKIQNTRVDLLAETGDELVQIELQSYPDADLPLRMAEYYLGIYRRTNRFPRQIVLYVGAKPWKIEQRLVSADLSFQFKLVDIREFDGDRLIQSDRLGDNVIAILARLSDREEAVQRILRAIGKLPVEERRDAMQVLLVLSGLRQLAGLIEREASTMPLLIDIMENEVLGREFKKGRVEGLQEGVHQGELAVLLRLITKRFGPVPAWAQQRLAQYSVAELEETSVRVLDTGSIEELLDSGSTPGGLSQ